jgi:hypothetical protein
MFIMTSNVVSREMKDAKVYCLSGPCRFRSSETYILPPSRDTDSIWDHQSCHLLLDRLDLAEWQNDLMIS